MQINDKSNQISDRGMIKVLLENEGKRLKSLHTNRMTFHSQFQMSASHIMCSVAIVRLQFQVVLATSTLSQGYRTCQVLDSNDFLHKLQLEGRVSL